MGYPKSDYVTQLHKQGHTSHKTAIERQTDKETKRNTECLKRGQKDENYHEKKCTIKIFCNARSVPIFLV